MIAPIRPGVSPFADEITAREFFRRVYQPQQLCEKSTATVELYEVNLNRLAKFLGHEPALREVSGDAIQDCMSWLVQRGRSPETANQFRAHLLALLHHAQAKRRPEVKRRRPEVRKLKSLKRKPRAWKLLEFEQLLAAARQTPGQVQVLEAAASIDAAAWWSALLLVLYDTGLRIGAAMGLEWRDLDWNEGAIWVRPELQKQDSEQYLDVSPDTIAALRAIRCPPRAIVFSWPWDRGARNWPTLNRHYRKILERAGLPITRRDLFHRVRRTTASYLKRAGLNPTERLGHSSAAVTAVYLDDSICRADRPSEKLPRPAIRWPEPPRIATPPRASLVFECSTLDVVIPEARPVDRQLLLPLND